MFNYSFSYSNYYIEALSPDKVLVFYTFNERNPYNNDYTLFEAAISNKDYKEIKEKEANAECLKKITDGTLFETISESIGGVGGRPEIIEEVAENDKYQPLMEKVHKYGGTEHIVDYMLYGGAYGLYNTNLLMYLKDKYSIKGECYDEAFIKETGNSFAEMCKLYLDFED